MTLKVSTIEQTASTADATGGKGNAKLVSWDYGKDISVTLEDALFSPKSMSLMYGGAKSTVDTTSRKLKKTINYLATEATEALPTALYKQSDGSYAVTSDGTETTPSMAVTWYQADASSSTDVATSATVAGERFIGVYEVEPTAGKVKVIHVDAAHFPGTYRIVGDTFARNEASGDDELERNSSLVA